MCDNTSLSLFIRISWYCTSNISRTSTYTKMCLPICKSCKSCTFRNTSPRLVFAKRIEASDVSIGIVTTRTNRYAFPGTSKGISPKPTTTSDGTQSCSTISKLIPRGWSRAFSGTAIVIIVTPSKCTLLWGWITDSCFPITVKECWAFK